MSSEKALLLAREGQPQCGFCGSDAAVLYDHLHDELYRTPGEWRLLRCRDRSCGMVSLDPMPDEAGIARAYETYYTHQPEQARPTVPAQRGGMRALMRRLDAWLLETSGTNAERARIRSCCLDGLPVGRVLEIGCGNGSRLVMLRQRGWEVLGQEIDDKASAVARDVHGLDVRVGPLADLGLPEASFDAVIMSHVLEHARQPVQLLQESWRLLKRGGRMVCVTPNLAGLGRRLFRRNWRGLEPPRHLWLFTTKTLALAAARAGVTGARCWTSAAESLGSSAMGQLGVAERGLAPLTQTRATVLRLHAMAFLAQHLATAVHPVLPGTGDQCVLSATK